MSFFSYIVSRTYLELIDLSGNSVEWSLVTVLSDTTDWNVFAFPLRNRKVTLL